MAAKTAARPRRSSPSRRRWLFIGPLAGLALAGLALFLYDYLNAGPAGPVRIVASIMFVTGTALTVLVLLGEERSAKAAVVAAGLIPVIVVLVQLPGPTTRPTHPVIRTPAQTACGPGHQHVRQLNRERDYRDELAMSNVNYTVRRSGEQLTFDLNARISGRLQPGSTLYLLTTADPSTHDSLVPPHPGFSGYTFFGPVVPAATGCWTAPTARLGYPGFCGVTAVLVLTLVSQEQATAWERQYNGPGHPPQTPVPLAKLAGAELLQSFPIPTRPYCPAPQTAVTG